MLLDKSIRELNQMLISGQTSAVELIQLVIDRLSSIEPQIHSFISVRDTDELLKHAKQIDDKRLFKDSLLAGIPYILKDSYLTTELPTTAGSKLLESFVSPYDATVHLKLKNAGAILVGKSSMDAWGHGGSSENTDFSIVKNPYDVSKTAGGSTGGVAAAIAARLVSFGIGEDTGGSIRNPSAWNSITGLKVSYGRVSRYGCIAYASSFDTVGPMAKSADDIAIILETIAGNDPKDATSSKKEVAKYSSSPSLKNLKVAIPKHAQESIDDEIKQALTESIKLIQSLGHTTDSVDMSTIESVIADYYLIGTSETSSNLARFDGIRYGTDRSSFTDESKRRIMLGTFSLSSGYYDAYYKKALKVRTLIIRAYNQVLSDYDCVLMPVTPMLPPNLGDLIDDPIANMMADVLTVSQNIAGIPSLAIPAGFSSSGLPIGVQISTKAFQESLLISLAKDMQSKTIWHQETPKL